MRYVFLGVGVVLSLCAATLLAQKASESRYLVTWVGDIDRSDSDFLAVLDVDPGSKTYTQVLNTVPVDAKGTVPHHTEHYFTPGHPLFANGFQGNRTFRFDLADPLHPRLVGSLDTIPSLAFPHSFARLPNGNVLATMQATGADCSPPGGLAEFRDDGSVVRSASAANDVDPGARLYSLLVLPAEDRVIAASGRMGCPMNSVGSTSPLDHLGFTIQLWRLSDLRLLKAIPLTLPSGAREGANLDPYEPRRLPNGEILLVTGRGGFYRLTGMEPETFHADFVFDFGGTCAVPVLVGKYWIQPVTSQRRVVAMDVSNAGKPFEISRVQFDDRQPTHWLSLDELSNRIIVANSSGEPRLWMLKMDPLSGLLSYDFTFHEPGTDRLGVSFEREQWPHGKTGPGMPHGSVFVR